MTEGGNQDLKFYWGLDGSGTDKKLPYTENVFLSASSLWKEEQENFSHPKLPAHDRFMLDSGGFSFFTKYDSYPYEPKDLANLARDIRPDYVATMDLPCEPEVLEKHNSTVGEQINRTVELAEKCKNYKIPGTWMPVIQGYEPGDYITCIRKYADRELLQDYMAVGSVCVRNSVNEMTDVITTVSEELKSRGYAANLHLFGLSINALKVVENYRRVYSSDSTAWKWNQYRYGDREGYMPKNEEDKLRNYPLYKQKIEEIKRENRAKIKNDDLTQKVLNW